MNRQSELVSVIVPAYNAGEYIEESITSICNQTYRNIEIIIIDDGSTDDTYDKCALLASADDRIILIRQENSGVVMARQKGLEMAKGRYVAFVDSDDWIDQDMVEILAGAIEDCDLVSTGILWEESKDRYLKRRDYYPTGIYEKGDLEEVYRSMLYNISTGMSHNFSSWMFNKLFVTEKALEIHSDLDCSLRLYEDAAFVYRYLLRCDRIKLIEEYPYHYRFLEESAFHKKRVNILEEISHVYSYMVSSFENEDPKYELKEQLQHWIMEKCYFTINERLDIPNGSRVIRYLLNTKGLENKRIAIYGAGRVGLDVRFQLLKLGYTVDLWVDRRYEICRKEGMDVDSPNSLVDGDFDLLLIAVENPKTSGGIWRDLVAMGIREDMIVNADITRLF